MQCWLQHTRNFRIQIHVANEPIVAQILDKHWILICKNIWFTFAAKFGDEMFAIFFAGFCAQFIANTKCSIDIPWAQATGFQCFSHDALYFILWWALQILQPKWQHFQLNVAIFHRICLQLKIALVKRDIKIHVFKVLTISYFRFESNNLDTRSGLWPWIFGATMANKIQASVALFVSKCVSIFDKVLALQMKPNI